MSRRPFLASPMYRPTPGPVPFFFSSRRRHTSSYGDWSSDVCSSDLRVELTAVALEVDVQDGQRLPDGALLDGRRVQELRVERRVLEEDRLFEPLQGRGRLRSEERRVGKEGRCGGGAEDQQTDGA